MASACRALLLLITLGSAAAHAAGDWRFLFDEEIPAELAVDDRVARVSRAPEHLIQGAGSLLCDTRTSPQQWHEVIVSRSAVRLEPGKRYAVSFLYRVLDNIDADFFCLLRPRAEEDRDRRRLFAPWWTGERGDDGRREAEFSLGPGDADFALVIGLHRRAALVIDELEITEISEDGFYRFIPYLRGGIPLDPSRRERIAALNRSRELGAVVEETAAVVASPPLPGNRTVAILDGDLCPDAVLGSSAEAFSVEHGVRSIGLCPPWTVIGRDSVPPPLWRSRFELMTDRGFLVALDGKIHQPVLLPADRYSMCVNGGFWNGLHRTAALAMLRDHDGLVLPGLGGTFAQDPVVCFCGSCNDGFTEWLRAIYTPRELRDWGIRSLDEFSFRTYTLRGARTGEGVLSDLVLREWVRWKHRAHLGRWAELVERIKEEGARRGFGVPVGAVPGLEGAANPYSVAAGAFHDFWVIPAGGNRPDAWLEIPVWLNSHPRGSSVWAVGAVALDAGAVQVDLSADLQYSDAAAALALGAVPVFAWDSPPAGTGVGPASAAREAAVARELLSALLARYRSLYAYRRSFHNVAVVYSVPSMLWHPSGEAPDPHYEAFLQACRTLREAGVPYDVFVFDHPLMLPEAERLARMAKYDALILPGVDCVSTAQIEVLSKFAGKGGRIYVEGACALFDEDYNPRGLPGLGIPALRDLSDARTAVAELRELSWVVLPRAGSSLIATAWRSQGGRMYAVHLARAPGGGHSADLSSPMPIAVKTPPDFEPDTALLLTPENPDGSRVRVARDPAGRLVGEISARFTYGVLVYSSEGYLARAGSDLALRRSRDRARVMTAARSRRSVAPAELPAGTAP